MSDQKWLQLKSFLNMIKDELHDTDELVLSLKTDGKVKRAKFKACKSRVTRRTCCTSQ